MVANTYKQTKTRKKGSFCDGIGMFFFAPDIRFQELTEQYRTTRTNIQNNTELLKINIFSYLQIPKKNTHMEKSIEKLKEKRKQQFINLSKELEHFYSYESNEMYDCIVIKRMIYSVEMKILRIFKDIMISSHISSHTDPSDKNSVETLISITIYK